MLHVPQTNPQLRLTAVDPEVQKTVPGRGSEGSLPLFRIDGKTHFTTPENTSNLTASGALLGLATIVENPKCGTYLP